MPLSALYTVLLSLIWTHTVHSNPDDLNHTARTIITSKDTTFRTFTLRHNESSDVWKLVKDPHRSNIYAGGSHSLYVFKSGEIQEAIDLCKHRDSACPYPLSVLTEGKNQNPLFICGKDSKQCCQVNAEHSLVNCTEMGGTAEDVNDAALYTGDTLYFTVSGERNAAVTLGLYRQRDGSYIWPQAKDIAQRYVRIITNETANDGKLYNFYIEKNPSEDPETPLWIPKVSQYCMADTGGSKNQLQYRWTSMLTARLFCGDKKRRQTFTELLDVAVLDSKNWGNTSIYALFRNEYSMTAVCVYKMSNITRIFASSNFGSSKDVTPQERAGECVANSEKTTPFLRFMEQRPEMRDWIEPEHGPLLVSHRRYTHLQVDGEIGRNNSQQRVLLLTLANGRIHKVLEKDGVPFIIAEYQPFENKTNVHSTLLDRSTKKLYVISSSQLVQIDLQDCSMYQKQCDCAFAKDPYCGWSGTACLSTAQLEAQGIRPDDNAVCKGKTMASEATTSRDSESSLIVPEHSKFFLKCSTPSQHASYSWTHQSGTVDCDSTNSVCILLIEKMSEADQGLYECVVSENNHTRTITSYQLKSTASQLRVAPTMLACLLLLVSLTGFPVLD